jgi:hypothetical protein
MSYRDEYHPKVKSDLNLTAIKITDKELDFIINHDIKHRMGQDREEK